MKKILLFLIGCLLLNSGKSQVIIYPDSLLAYEQSGTSLCYNNSSLMAGNSIGDRYLIYFNADSIFLNAKQSGTWTRKTAYTGSNIKLATLALNKDTIWICWKESAYIKARYSVNKGNTWSNVLNVSAAGNVSAPSMYASSNGKIHFVWHNESATDSTVSHNVYFNGAFLPSPNTLSSYGFKASWPSVTAIGDTVLCSWKETHGVAKIYFACSFNGGQAGSWSPSDFTDGPNTAKDPNLSYAFDENTNTHYVYLVYDGNQNIYLQRSTDFGSNWTPSAIISNTAKNSQFAKVESNNSGFVGVSWEHRTVVSLFDDTKKDVGFVYSTNWANTGSFGADSLAYTHNPFGSTLTSLNKIDSANFYLVWLSNDTVLNRNIIYERHIGFSATSGINDATENQSDILIYPTATAGSIIIKNKNPLINIGWIKIYDVLGKEVAEKTIAGSIETIDVSFLQNGVYFIKTMINTTQTHKIIVQNEN